MKADIFHAFVSLLKQTKPTPKLAASVAAANNGMDEDGAVTKLLNQVPAIIKAIHKLMKEKSVKTRQGCFHLLSELILVLPGCLAVHIPQLIPGIQFSLR